MPDPTLLLLLDEVRGKTLRALEGVGEERARWAPPGLQNSILWHAGHSYIVVEWLTMGALDRPARAPDGWFETFSWESRPAEVPEDRWPSLAEVIARLHRQQTRLGSLISELTDEQLDAPSARNAERTVLRSIVHGLHDEACHCGEILLLRKLLAKLSG